MNLGINFITKSVVQLFLIFFFIILLAYYFSQREGMKVSLIYHPLQNTKGMIQFYSFDDSEETRANLPNILNIAAPVSQTNLYDATLLSDEQTIYGMIAPYPRIGNSSLKLDMTQKQFVKLPSFIIPQTPDKQIFSNTGMTFTLFFKIMVPISQTGIMTLFDYSNSKYRLTAYYNIATQRLECISSFDGILTQSLQSTTATQINLTEWNHFAWTLSPESIDPTKGGQSVVYLNFNKYLDFASTNPPKGFVYPSMEFLNNGDPVTLTDNVIGKCTRQINNYSVDNSYFNGYIDNFIVYNSAYTSNNITQLSTLYSSKSTSYTLDT